MEEQDAQIYDAEYIIKKRENNGKTEYLVKWKNWARKDSTWEPEEHILDQRLITNFENSR